MKAVLQRFNLTDLSSGCYAGEWLAPDGEGKVDSLSPVDGQTIAQVSVTSAEQYNQVIESSNETFLRWRVLPAPERGQIVRQIGNALRDCKTDLGKLISAEMGKVLSEGEGEVQEAIDVADFAVGLSRQLYGKTMHSERPSHRMYEQWHPLGPVGCITAFNFPVAVWAWNAMIAAVCGDTVIWKPSEHTLLSSVATQRICAEVATQAGYPGLFNLICDSGPELGKKLAADTRVPLISATGSCLMGRSVGETVAKRFGKSILELGGNNAIIVCEDADLDLVIPATLFGAVGTSGQRCTTTRRAFVHKDVFDEFSKRLIAAYAQIRIGSPLEQETLMGPLVHQSAVGTYTDTLETVLEQGGEILCGGKVLTGMPSSLYVEPVVVRAPVDMPLLKEERFVPILYLVAVEDLEQALQLHNDVPQGLSSAIFTRDLQRAERFLSVAGSDCGIANVNIGTSGAEIGGAFGGEKETGGGRESGSDSWKQYMRRQTNTINWSDKLPLAQGVTFEV